MFYGHKIFQDEMRPLFSKALKLHLVFNIQEKCSTVMHIVTFYTFLVFSSQAEFSQEVILYTWATLSLNSIQ